jgi:hypothetical protein
MVKNVVSLIPSTLQDALWVNQKQINSSKQERRLETIYSSIY